MSCNPNKVMSCNPNKDMFCNPNKDMSCNPNKVMILNNYKDIIDNFDMYLIQNLSTKYYIHYIFNNKDIIKENINSFINYINKNNIDNKETLLILLNDSEDNIYKHIVKYNDIVLLEYFCENKIINTNFYKYGIRKSSLIKILQKYDLIIPFNMILNELIETKNTNYLDYIIKNYINVSIYNYKTAFSFSLLNTNVQLNVYLLQLEYNNIILLTDIILLLLSYQDIDDIFTYIINQKLDINYYVILRKASYKKYYNIILEILQNVFINFVNKYNSIDSHFYGIKNKINYNSNIFLCELFLLNFKSFYIIEYISNILNINEILYYDSAYYLYYLLKNNMIFYSYNKDCYDELINSNLNNLSLAKFLYFIVGGSGKFNNSDCIEYRRDYIKWLLNKNINKNVELLNFSAFWLNSDDFIWLYNNFNINYDQNTMIKAIKSGNIEKVNFLENLGCSLNITYDNLDDLLPNNEQCINPNGSKLLKYLTSKLLNFNFDNRYIVRSIKFNNYEYFRDLYINYLDINNYIFEETEYKNRLFEFIKKYKNENNILLNITNLMKINNISININDLYLPNYIIIRPHYQKLLKKCNDSNNYIVNLPKYFIDINETINNYDDIIRLLNIYIYWNVCLTKFANIIINNKNIIKKNIEHFKIYINCLRNTLIKSDNLLILLEDDINNIYKYMIDNKVDFIFNYFCENNMINNNFFEYNIKKINIFNLNFRKYNLIIPFYNQTGTRCQFANSYLKISSIYEPR
jgi:hypothetical protein